MYSKTIETKVGNITIYANETAVTKINFETVTLQCSNSVIELCEKQILEYLNGTRKQFTIPIQYEGSTFQKKVWETLIKIPYGEVKTYKQIAEEIKHPKAYRAVGNANHHNPLLLVIPCHRVVSTNSIGGYAGGEDTKRELLKIEKLNK